MLECIYVLYLVCIYRYAFLWSHAFIKNTHTCTHTLRLIYVQYKKWMLTTVIDVFIRCKVARLNNK